MSRGRSNRKDSGYSLPAANVSGTGWTMVLSGLKTLLETGEPLDG